VLALARLASRGVSGEWSEARSSRWPVGWIASSLPPSLVELCRYAASPIAIEQASIFEQQKAPDDAGAFELLN
jgi:hypothetical protein